jgi:hypothetical protein
LQLLSRALASFPIWAVALLLLILLCLAGAVGVALRLYRNQFLEPGGEALTDGQEGYIVSAVLGLLALLMGFTFSLAVDRFDARRVLVLTEANAIGTAYLRSQLLPEPHRARMSALLVRYTDNRLALAKAKAGPRQVQLLAANDALITDLWSGTAAAFDSIKGLDFSSTYVEAINTVIDLDSARKAARQARVPPAVFTVLVVYLITTAAVLGYVLGGVRGRLAAFFLLALLTLGLVLIVDIDRPTGGAVVESQGPMEALQRSLAGWPPSAFDRWRQAPQP